MEEFNGAGKPRALICSDWSECLSPNGPFDPISFNYPEYSAELEDIFRKYTGNIISLGRALDMIINEKGLTLSQNQMERYMEQEFSMYKGVRELIQWAISNNILFVINSTGFQGYFQMAFRMGLIPRLLYISANPMIRFEDDDSTTWFDIYETTDKPRNTEKILSINNIPPQNTVLIGDSGGDGPHFEWGAKAGAKLIGSMPKWSLIRYCRERGIRIHHMFGVIYGEGEKRDPEREKEIDFSSLISEIKRLLNI